MSNFFYRITEDFHICQPNQMIAIDNLFGPHEARFQVFGNLTVIIVHRKVNLRMNFFQVIFGGPRNQTSTHTFHQNEFCISFVSMDLEYFHPRIFVCEEDNAEKGEDFISIFNPLSLFISCTFILFTLLIFALLPDLRKSLFSKITMGFLINVFFCYLFLAVRYSIESENILSSTSCICLGYLIHHTFISFFFWMNAMALNMTIKFSDIFKEDTTGHVNALIKNTAYAQVYL